MKTKIYVLAALLMASMTNVMAEDIFSGSRALSYYNEGTESTLFIDYTKFSSAQAGNEIKITGDITGIDHKLYIGEYNTANHHPGSDYRNITSLPFSFYLTEDMIAKIGNATHHEDFRLYGEGITVTKVELCPGKAGALKFGKTIWTGYFWMDDKWSLEIFKEAFASIDFSKYGIMRIYYEANRNDFLMRLFTKFGTPGADDFTDETSIKLAGSELDNHMGEHATRVTPKKIYLHDTYVDVPLTDTIKTYLKTNNDEKGGSLFIKCNLINGVAPFNVTDVVLLPISPDGCDNCFYVY